MNKKFVILFASIAIASFGFYLYTKQKEKKFAEQRDLTYTVEFTP